jgi:hypothetical protein
MPSVDPAAFWDGVDLYFTVVGESFATAKNLTAEPLLACRTLGDDR